MACILSNSNGYAQFPDLGYAKSLAELKDTLINILPMFGWHYFQLSEVERRKGGIVLDLLGNVPTEWLAKRGELLGDSENPLHRVCDGAKVVKWTDVPNLLSLELPQRAYLECAKRYGLVYGLTLTVPSVGGGKILFSIGRPDFPDVSDNEQVISRDLGYAIAERVMELRDSEAGQEMRLILTPRQISCVGLISRGFSDQQIAERLKISAETVKEHVSAARLRLGVKRRTELVYKLTRAGLII